MKKFFASLLALVGMVAGLALTSCGGGGSGANLAGTRITAECSQSAYTLVFFDKLGEGYTGEISDAAGIHTSNLLIWIDPDTIKEEDGKLVYFEGRVSSTSLNRDDRKALYMICSGFDSTNPNITALAFTEGPRFRCDLTNKTIYWTAVGTWSAIADNVKIEDAEIETLDRPDAIFAIE